MTACPLCASDGGDLIWRGEHLRVIRADEAGFPAFYRVIWNAHVAEFSDLSLAERAHCMEAVALVEQLLREHLQPTKINLAALGNMVPHLHWHVIARFDWDSHFPAPVWAGPQRARDVPREDALRARLVALDAALRARLGAPGTACVAATHSVSRSLVSRCEAAGSAVARQGEATTTRVIEKWNKPQR